MLVEHIQEFLKTGEESFNRTAIPKLLFGILVLCMIPYVFFFVTNQTTSFFQLIILGVYTIWSIRLRIDRAHFVSFVFLHRGVGCSLPAVLWLHMLSHLFQFSLRYCFLAILLILLIGLVIWLSIVVCRRRILAIASGTEKKNDPNSMGIFARVGGALGVTVAGPLLFQNISQQALFIVAGVLVMWINLLFLFFAGGSWYKFYLFWTYRSQLTDHLN